MKKEQRKEFIRNHKGSVSENLSLSNYKHSEITEAIIGAAYKVYAVLGYGFAEKVYENALFHELYKSGMMVSQQAPITVFYDKIIVGDYVADLIVNQKVIVEIKAVNEINPVHEVQLVNYLKGTGIEVGLLINFGPELTFKRRVFSKEYSTQRDAEEKGC